MIRILLLLMLLSMGGAAWAQEELSPPPLPDPSASVAPPVDVEPADPVIAQVNRDMDAEISRLDRTQGGIPTLLFTEAEQAELARAIALYQSGAYLVEPEPEPDVNEPPMMARVLTLSGLSYGDGTNWVVWLNGMRVTSSSQPSEIRAIQVYKNYIEVRWYDSVSDTTIPVRLKPNQRFNLDTRSFLPG